MNPYDRKNAQKNALLEPALKKYMRECGVDAYSDPGKYAETGLAALISTFVANTPLKAPKEGQKPTQVRRGMAQDYLLGTDLILQDQPRTMLLQNILRLDFTIGLNGKKDMPLMTPDKTMSLTDPGCNRGAVDFGNGDYMRFGIRIGNGRYGFDSPVVVAALCSPQELDPRRVRENIEYLQSRVMDSAPEIIRGATMAMERFRYMTDPAHKTAIDKRNSPEAIRKCLPVLVGNWMYLRQEAGHAKARAEHGRGRMCWANVADALGTLERNYVGDPVSAETDVPWMSPKGHAAVAAMSEGPRRMPASDASFLSEIRSLILAEPVREPGQKPPIVVDRHGNRLDDGPFRKAVRDVATVLDRKFDAQGPGSPGGPRR